jgi:hypothetical protein
MKWIQFAAISFRTQHNYTLQPVLMSRHRFYTLIGEVEKYRIVPESIIATYNKF